MKCPACDSEELSEEASFASFENSVRFKDWEPGILQYKELSIGAETARICLACGYILHFAGAKDLAKLRAGRPG